MKRQQTLDQYGLPYHRGWLMFILLFGSFFPILNETTLATAYPKLMSYFGVGASTIQWLTSAFLMVGGIMIPISAWLMTRINTKVLFLVSSIIFEVGTIIAWMSTTFSMLLVARIIQAISTGISMPLFQSIIFHIYPKNERGGAMGLGGLVLGLSPAIGPTLSGWIIDNASWRDLFGMNIIPMILVIILTMFLFRPVLPTHKSPLNMFSVVLSTIGFGSLLYGFSSVGSDGWISTTVLSTLIVGIIFIALFIIHELHTNNPLINFSVFKNYEFNLGTIIGSTVMMGLVGFEMILPLYLQTVRGDNAFHSGLTLLLGALMIGLISPITGKIYDHYGARSLCISGTFLMGVGSLPFLFLTKGTPVLYIVILYAIRSVGIAMALMTITTYSLNTLPSNMIDAGTSATNTVKQIASSIATAILTSVLSNITKASKPSHNLINLDPLHFKDSMINAVLNGYHSAFAVALLFCIIGLVCAFFIKRAKKRASRKEDA